MVHNAFALINLCCFTRYPQRTHVTNMIKMSPSKNKNDKNAIFYFPSFSFLQAISPFLRPKNMPKKKEEHPLLPLSWWKVIAQWSFLILAHFLLVVLLLFLIGTSIRIDKLITFPRIAYKNEKVLFTLSKSNEPFTIWESGFNLQITCWIKSSRNLVDDAWWNYSTKIFLKRKYSLLFIEKEKAVLICKSKRWNNFDNQHKHALHILEIHTFLIWATTLHRI